uniref:Uncharacterized protein n=1 Tax=Tanacetum cinerariifolium TaxID=118510 RepID=A0A699H6M7_TANCI|nr:hypothetical protein [Tanacetum cinerariifolium]
MLKLTFWTRGGRGGDYMEDYKSNESSLRLFLPMVFLDKDNFSELSHEDGQFKTFVQHVESTTRKSIELKSLKKIDLAFMSIDNDGHRFLCF